MWGKRTASLLCSASTLSWTAISVSAHFWNSWGLDMGRLPRELSDMEKVLKDGCALDMLKEKLVRLFEEVMTLRDSQTASKYSQVLDEAKAFIYDNYAKEEISLNTVAARVNISPSYFSSIFSQEMGVTFVEFLTGVRMEKAKELLKEVGWPPIIPWMWFTIMMTSRPWTL